MCGVDAMRCILQQGTVRTRELPPQVPQNFEQLINFTTPLELCSGNKRLPRRYM